MSSRVVLGSRSVTELTGPELMKIGHDSVGRVWGKLGGTRMGHGTAFAYKQVTGTPSAGMSRLYFVTNLHNVKGTMGMFPIVVRGARNGAPADALNISWCLEFRGVEYVIPRAVVAKGMLFANNEFVDDFCFFHIDVPLEDDIMMFALPTADEPAQGDDVFAIGFPYDTDLGITEGIVSHVYGDTPEIPGYRWQIQHSILLNGGNSGGPTVNRHGVAVGISTWGMPYTPEGRRLDGMNFSVNLHHLFERAADTASLEEVDLAGIFDRLLKRATEEAKFGN